MLGGIRDNVFVDFIFQFSVNMIVFNICSVFLFYDCILIPLHGIDSDPFVGA